MEPKRLAPLALAAAAGLLGGCMAYSNVKHDTDRMPVVNTGVGAAVLMPGQGVPMMPVPARGGVGQRGAPPPVYASPGSGGTSGSYNSTGSGSGNGSSSSTGPGSSGGGYANAAPGDPQPGGGTNIQFIGGAEVDETAHYELHQDPLLAKALLAPFAVAAYPFKKLIEKIQGEPKPVLRPEAQGAPPRGPADAEADYEQSQLDQLERQVGSPHARVGSTVPPQGASAPQVASAPPPYAGGVTGQRASIADELQSLQRRVQPRGVAPSAAGPGTAPTPDGVADKVSDRNGDGRPDVWQYRENGALVRELFDEDGDGRVDHTIRYDPATGQKVSEEEDTNVDGRIDSWVEYQNGQVARRRQDTNGDGEPDTWTLYRNGQIARVEEDRNGDGFRDRVAYYQDGKMRREVEDANGDGRPERVTLYDANERATERSEDNDGDGYVDARSYFQNGKLVRREVIDASASAPQPMVEEEQLATPQGFSDGNEPAPAPTGDDHS